jgi:hypothetical protein
MMMVVSRRIIILLATLHALLEKKNARVLHPCAAYLKIEVKTISEHKNKIWIIWLYDIQKMPPFKRKLEYYNKQTYLPKA